MDDFISEDQTLEEAEEEMEAYHDYYGISAKEFQGGYHDGDYEIDPPEISWEEFCLYNDKEPYDDYE